MVPLVAVSWRSLMALAVLKASRQQPDLSCSMPHPQHRLQEPLDSLPAPTDKPRWTDNPQTSSLRPDPARDAEAWTLFEQLGRGTPEFLTEPELELKPAHAD